MAEHATSPTGTPPSGGKSNVFSACRNNLAKIDGLDPLRDYDSLTSASIHRARVLMRAIGLELQIATEDGLFARAPGWEMRALMSVQELSDILWSELERAEAFSNAVLGVKVEVLQ